MTIEQGRQQRRLQWQVHRARVLGTVTEWLAGMVILAGIAGVVALAVEKAWR